MHVNVGLGIGRAAKVIKNDALTERYAEQHGSYGRCNESVGERHEQNTGREEKEERPGDTDDAPWRFVVNDAVGSEHPNSVDCEVAHVGVLEELARAAKDKTDKQGPLIARHQPNPVVVQPVNAFDQIALILLVSVTLASGLKPGFETFVEAFDSSPMEECARVKEDNRSHANQSNHQQIKPVPDLSCAAHIGCAVEAM